MFVLTSAYAGPLALLFLVLSIQVILHRRRARVSVGDGGDAGLIKAMRTQANFSEYAPLGLLLLALCEAQGAPEAALHLLGVLLVLGRMLHALGFGRARQMIRLRQAGILMNFVMFVLAGLGLMAHALL